MIEAVIFDWGGTLDGYNSDVTRTVHVGPPGDEYRRIYQVVLEANEATFNAVTVDDHTSTNDTAVLMASGASGDVVGIDDRAGVAELARHLANLGHRRFATITLPLSSPASPALGWTCV